MAQISLHLCDAMVLILAGVLVHYFVLTIITMLKLTQLEWELKHCTHLTVGTWADGCAFGLGQ